MAVFQPKKILVPLDFSKTSLSALDGALAISKKTGADLLLLHVSEGLSQNLEPGYFVHPPTMIDYQVSFIEQSNKHLAAIAGKMKAETTGKIKTYTETGTVHSTIRNFANQEKVDLIVMGTHGVSGVKEFFVGSNTFRVIRDSKCPVLSIKKKTPKNPFRKILMPFRDKPHSREKVNYAIDVALLFSSEIYVLGVDTEQTAAHKKKIQLEAKQIKEIVSKKNIKCLTTVISRGYAGDVVLDHAKKIEADLLISMSDLDKLNIFEYFTGPFSQQIVNHSPIPVLSIRPRFNTDTIDLRFY